MKTDKQIQQDVMDELEWDPEIDSSEIGVAVRNGIVTLSGQITSYAKKLAAEKAAKRIKEVKGIAEELVVKIPSHGKRTDSEIADAIVRALKWNTSIPDEKIKVKVEDGWVTLEGELNWEFQKDQAKQVVGEITGVVGIANLVTIKPRVKTDVVKGKIKEALERSADVEADRIQVEAEGSKVILKGKVRTWSEMNEVERAAWSAPGVTSVEDNMTLL
ncbi:MAG TPA: BON domain-containing protein [Candidatus Paceibacterota bacterium]